MANKCLITCQRNRRIYANFIKCYRVPNLYVHPLLEIVVFMEMTESEMKLKETNEQRPLSHFSHREDNLTPVFLQSQLCTCTIQDPPTPQQRSVIRVPDFYAKGCWFIQTKVLLRKTFATSTTILAWAALPYSIFKYDCNSQSSALPYQNPQSVIRGANWHFRELTPKFRP